MFLVWRFRKVLDLYLVGVENLRGWINWWKCSIIKKVDALAFALLHDNCDLLTVFFSKLQAQRFHMTLFFRSKRRSKQLCQLVKKAPEQYAICGYHDSLCSSRQMKTIHPYIVLMHTCTDQVNWCRTWELVPIGANTAQTETQAHICYTKPRQKGDFSFMGTCSQLLVCMYVPSTKHSIKEYFIGRFALIVKIIWSDCSCLLPACIPN